MIMNLVKTVLLKGSVEGLDRINTSLILLSSGKTCEKKP